MFVALQSMANPIARKLTTYDVLTAKELLVLESAISGIREVHAGKDMSRVGERPAHSTAILEGWAARYKVLTGGKRQITAIHVPGDFVDLQSFLLHKMDHAVMALSHCRVAMVPHEKLRVITETEPHLTRVLWTSTLTDAAMHREWLVAMGQLDTPAHTAHLICELYLRLKTVGLASDHSFKLPMKQSELADTVGVSAVHMNRSLQEIRSMDLITLQSGQLVIRDWVRLTRFAQFESGYLHQEREPR